MSIFLRRNSVRAGRVRIAIIIVFASLVTFELVFNTIGLKEPPPSNYVTAGSSNFGFDPSLKK